VGQGIVEGEYGLAGSKPQPAGQDPNFLPDPIILATAVLMNKWLGFWGRIDASKIKGKDHLLQPKTLEVLGTHLWNLILQNDVGDALKRCIPKQGSKPPLRLSIEFADDADETLKGLPWEFLYEPDSKFLATKTELLLTRYVSMPNGRIEVSQVGDREEVRALLIAALPDDDKFDTERKNLRNLRTALTAVAHLWVPDVIEVWDAAKIEKELEDTEYHIIHVVGICHGTPGHAQIYLGGDSFQDPAKFVEVLTTNPKRPRLIILQLCDYVDGDATENFELLAPALIRNEVPAVLALQYAIKQADQVGLGKGFYESLVKGEAIGAAVQASRRQLSLASLAHRFGTPVLYLQEDGPLCPRRSPVYVTTASNAPSSTVSAREVMYDVADNVSGLGEEETDRILNWIVELDPGIGYAEARIKIRDRRLTVPHDQASHQVYRKMSKALQDMEARNGRV
jgi:hypothetical protein